MVFLSSILISLFFITLAFLFVTNTKQEDEVVVAEGTGRRNLSREEVLGTVTSNVTVVIPVCGNNIKEGDEECDGSDFGGITCTVLGYEWGTLLCTEDCEYDVGGCYDNTFIGPSPSAADEEEPDDPDHDINDDLIIEDDEDDEDTDGDGIPDYWEKNYSCMDYLTKDANLDYDSDDLDNFSEYKNDCDPCSEDTDGDGMPDGWEVGYGLDPLIDDSSEDPDKDGFTNLTEYKNNTNPLVADLVLDGSTPETGEKEEIFGISRNLLILLGVIGGGTAIVLVYLASRNKGVKEDDLLDDID